MPLPADAHASLLALMSKWKGAHILSVEQFDEPMLLELFGVAARLKRMVAASGKCDVLRGRVLANVFYEPSTRTQCSFATAMLRLGGDVVSVNESSSSAKKGETIEDTVRCLQCYCDVLVLRHPQKGTAAAAAGAAAKPVINAGDGVGEHPTQALLDLFTVVDAHPRAGGVAGGGGGGGGGLGLGGLRLTLLGDLKHGRTVHSLALLAARVAAPPRLAFCAPASLGMPDEVTAALTEKGVAFDTHDSLAAALPQSDVLYVTRVQKERFPSAEAYDAVRGAYIVDRKALDSAPKDCIVMHPLPRVDEIATDVDADPRAKYFEQMENGMYVRMALLALVLGADLSALPP